MLAFFACTDPPSAHLAAASTFAYDGFRLDRVAAVSQVTGITAAPGADPTALWVTAQEGRIVGVAGGKETVLLDLSDRVASGGEMGLLGLAVSPRADDRRVFVNYTWRHEKKLKSRIAAYPFEADGRIRDAEQILLEYDQPWANHNSGAMTFGADGMLYLAVGDGGSGGDPKGTGQRTDDLLGSILRIDVRGTPYTVPPDNPLVADPQSRPELWAWGVRNPWGMHADGDHIYFADVGQNKWEEMDHLVKGGNYGWNQMEATHCFQADPCPGDFVAPLAEYGHDVGSSVTGGVVYRGPSIPSLDGRLLYADFSSGAFFGLRVKDGQAAGAPEKLPDLHKNPSAFGRDQAGNVYVADYGTGVYRFVPG